MKDKYLDIYQQEALQEALVELKQARQRERLLADENKAILSAISAMSEAKNRHEIFTGLNNVLKKYINFDDFIVLTRDDERRPFLRTILQSALLFFIDALTFIFLIFIMPDAKIKLTPATIYR